MSKIKILLIDDEPDFLKLMGTRIRSWGYDLIEASNGKEAINLMAGEKPEIIILDYIMPGMDGIATLKGIRKSDRKIPVVMFTAHPDEKSVKGAMDLDVSAFVPKMSVYSDTQSALKTALKMAEKKLKKGVL